MCELHVQQFIRSELGLFLNGGDTHFYKVDKPLIDATHLLPNFTRVETFGSPNIHWLRVTVDVSTPDVFTFHPMIVEANK